MSTQTEVTLIKHHHNDAEMFDTAALCLARLGYKVNHCYPFDGDELEPQNGLTPTVILGGGQNVTEIDSLPFMQQEMRWIEACIASETPILGICLGAQLLAHTLGGKILRRDPPEVEFGFYKVYPTDEAGSWLSEPQVFMQAHYEEFSLPDGAVRLAYSDRYPQQAFRYGSCAYAVQFHPEVTLDIHSDWMADTWSAKMASTTGAQSKDEQRALAPLHIDKQVRWFEDMLQSLFG